MELKQKQKIFRGKTRHEVEAKLLKFILKTLGPSKKGSRVFYTLIRSYRIQKIQKIGTMQYYWETGIRLYYKKINTIVDPVNNF